MDCHKISTNLLCYKYTLFDGLAYNTYGYFAHCSYFSSPLRGSENTTQLAKYPYVLHAKPSNKRFIIPLQRKLSGNWVLFFGKSIQSILILSVRMTLAISKMFALVICQTIEWEVNYFTAKEKRYVGFYFLIRVSKTSWFCQPWLLLLHPPVFALL